MTMPGTNAVLSRERVQALLDRMSRCRVVVLGDAMLDVHLAGDSERLSPEAPVPVVAVRQRRYAPGGAGNVAANVAAIGGEARLVAVIGEDSHGDALRAELIRRQVVDDHLVVLSDRPTTTKTRVMARGQQLVRVDEEVEHHIPPGAEQVVLAQLERALAGADILLLEDYNKGLLTPGVIAGALSRSKPGSVPTVVDPKFKHFFRYRGATVFKPNKHELARAMGDTFDPGTLSGLSRCRADVGADNLLLTLGSQGMVLVTKDGEVTRIPAVAREVFDVSGAGDTVTAWVGAALGAGATMFEAAQIANFAAGVEVGKLGVATPSPAEVLAAYDAYSDHLATSDCRREPA